MPLTFKTEEEFQAAIPEALRAEFTQLDGVGWAPKGYVPESAHNEMKTRTEAKIKKLEQLEAQAAKWKDLDPEKARKALVEAKELRDKLDASESGLPPEELEKKYLERYQRHLDGHNEEKAKLEKEIAALNSRLDELEIDGAVAAAAAKLDDFLHHASVVRDAKFRARQIFARKNGALEAKDGDKPLLGKDGKAITIDEWLELQREESPHWFKATASGGGAGGNDGGAGGSKKMSRQKFDALPIEEKPKAAREFTITD